MAWLDYLPCIYQLWKLTSFLILPHGTINAAEECRFVLLSAQHSSKQEKPSGVSGDTPVTSSLSAFQLLQSCYPDAEDITDVANWDAKVIQCLQDYRDELKDPLCRQQVFQLTKRASEDIRFEKPLADACKSKSWKGWWVYICWES